MMITVSILLALASVSLPLGKMTGKRAQEMELRQKLRELRMAIDEFKRDWARDGEVMTGPLCVKNKLTCKEVTGVTGYPKSLDVLLSVSLSGGEASVKEQAAVRRYLRRIPSDPVTGVAEWGLRCYQDPPDVSSWCKDDVFDVRSLSGDQASDGTTYREW
jgi:general secretion pathway protein G